MFVRYIWTHVLKFSLSLHLFVRLVSYWHTLWSFVGHVIDNSTGDIATDQYHRYGVCLIWLVMNSREEKSFVLIYDNWHEWIFFTCLNMYIVGILNWVIINMSSFRRTYGSWKILDLMHIIYRSLGHVFFQVQPCIHSMPCLLQPMFCYWFYKGKDHWFLLICLIAPITLEHYKLCKSLSIQWLFVWF